MRSQREKSLWTTVDARQQLTYRHGSWPSQSIKVWSTKRLAQAQIEYEIHWFIRNRSSSNLSDRIRIESSVVESPRWFSSRSPSDVRLVRDSWNVFETVLCELTSRHLSCFLRNRRDSRSSLLQDGTSVGVQDGLIGVELVGWSRGV